METAPSEVECARAAALLALLDRPSRAARLISDLDPASIAEVTRVAACRCHEVLLQAEDVADSQKCKAAWKALRRTQQVQEWQFDVQWAGDERRIGAKKRVASI